MKILGKSRKVLSVLGLFAGVIALVGITTFQAQASVSSYSASGFAQFCASNPSTCVKQDANGGSNTGLHVTVSCPDETQVIDAVYVHAGEGQTVYLLPDSNFTYTFSNNNSTVTVNKAGQHDISWVGITCSTGSQNPTNTPTPTPTNTPTPTATLIPTPTCAGTCVNIDCNGGGTCEVIIGNTPTPTLTATPTATLTPTPTSGSSNTTSSNSSNNTSSSSNSSGSSSPTQAVLGASTSTLASTGAFDQNLMNMLLSAGMLSLSGGSYLYAKTKKS